MNYTKLEDCLLVLRDCLQCLSGISVLVFYLFVFILVHSALVPNRGADAPTPEQGAETMLVTHRVLEGLRGS